MSSDDDEIRNRVISAKFGTIDAAFLNRIQEITTTPIDKLWGDPKAMADDLQTVAGLALHLHEQVELLIALLREIGRVGTLHATPPEKPGSPPTSGRF
jgi:hypothetical protein